MPVEVWTFAFHAVDFNSVPGFREAEGVFLEEDICLGCYLR